MGKTVGSLIQVAGIVAVNFIPGLGQIATAAILAGTAVAGAVVSGMGRRASKPAQTETSIKTERPVRVSGYGRARRTGAFLP